MKVGFLSSDFSMSYRDGEGHPTPGGAGHYRCALPAKYLSLAGHEVYHSGRGGTSGDELVVIGWDGEPHTDLDIIILQRWMDQWTPELIRKARANGQIVINDIDDWFGGVRPSNNAYWHSHPAYNPDRNVNHYRKSLQAGTALTVSTPYLADRYSQMGIKNIEVIRNGIEIDSFKYNAPLDSRKPVYGWVGATPFRSGDLETLRGVIGPFLDRYGLTFHHSGHLDGCPTAAELARITPKRVTTESMQPIEHYPQMFDAIDVGLAPLSNIPFNQAKSAIKVMEYAARGIPFIAADTPEYRWFGEGLIAKKSRPASWKKHLEAMLDPDLRYDLAKHAHERVLLEDMNIRYLDWERYYESLLH